MTTQLITTLNEFENLLVIAKRHGLTQFKVGDIEVVMPLSAPEQEKIVYTEEAEPSSDEIDATIYRTTLNM